MVSARGDRSAGFSRRSRIMSKIKDKDTKPEKLVRSLLDSMGYRFHLHVKNLPGKPDIVLPRHKRIIFVHGCFWHGHANCKRATKINGNRERDERALVALQSMRYQCLVI
jgi:DNA mismatch endonuclease (patch repair protein)